MLALLLFGMMSIITPSHGRGMVWLLGFTTLYAKSYWLSYLSAYARQPARGPTMLAHLVAICWPMLAHVELLTQLGAMLAYLEGYVGRS